eukprot:Colp12_sorted_trinity150504_noHs@24287
MKDLNAKKVVVIGLSLFALLLLLFPWKARITKAKMALIEDRFVPFGGTKAVSGEYEGHMEKLKEVAKKDVVKAYLPSQLRKPYPANYKTVYFMRHGQGTHNKAAKEIGRHEYQNEAWMDARLTDLGKEQARVTIEYTRKLSVELVVVSPLSRATETALLAFSDFKGPFIALENAREQSGQNPCDKRRTKLELEREYGDRVDYSELASDEDPMYTPEREPKASVVARARQVLAWIMARPESEIGVVTHSAYLLSMFTKAVDCSAAPELEEWFETSEVRAVVLAPLDALPN